VKRLEWLEKAFTAAQNQLIDAETVIEGVRAEVANYDSGATLDKLDAFDKIRAILERQP
jgi:hypothetical protein